MLSQNEAKVLETVSAAHDLHLQIPLVISVEDGLDKVRLPVRNVKKDAIIFQHSRDLDPVSINTAFLHSPCKKN